MGSTKKQKLILDFIVSYLKRHGVAPLVDEIKEHFGFSSRGTVDCYLRYLRESGVPGKFQWLRQTSNMPKVGSKNFAKR